MVMSSLKQPPPSLSMSSTSPSPLLSSSCCTAASAITTSIAEPSSVTPKRFTTSSSSSSYSSSSHNQEEVEQEDASASSTTATAAATTTNKASVLYGRDKEIAILRAVYERTIQPLRQQQQQQHQPSNRKTRFAQSSSNVTDADASSSSVDVASSCYGGANVLLQHQPSDVANTTTTSAIITMSTNVDYQHKHETPFVVLENSKEEGSIHNKLLLLPPIRKKLEQQQHQHQQQQQHPPSSIVEQSQQRIIITRPQEFVLLQGASGTGKTALVTHSLKKGIHHNIHHYQRNRFLDNRSNMVQDDDDAGIVDGKEEQLEEEDEEDDEDEEEFGKKAHDQKEDGISVSSYYYPPLEFFFLHGKFDVNFLHLRRQQQDPYAVYVSAMTQFVEAYTKLRKNALDNIILDTTTTTTNANHDTEQCFQGADVLVGATTTAAAAAAVSDAAAAAAADDKHGQDGMIDCEHPQSRNIQSGDTNDKNEQHNKLALLLFRRLEKAIQDAVFSNTLNDGEGQILTDIIPALKQLLALPVGSGHCQQVQQQEQLRRQPSSSQDKCNNDDDIKDVADSGDYPKRENDDSNVHNKDNHHPHTPSIMTTKISDASLQHRFHVMFCRLLRAISTVVPVVLFLDDLQWSDKASLELLKAILTSSTTSYDGRGGSSSSSMSNPNESRQQALMESSTTSALLVIGAYRNNDDVATVQEQPTTMDTVSALPLGGSNHSPSIKTSTKTPFQDFLQTIMLPESSAPGSSPTSSLVTLPNHSTAIRLTQVSLSNLSEPAVNEMVASALPLLPESTAALAHMVYAKSKGNAFYAKQYIRLIALQHQQAHHYKKEPQQERRCSHPKAYGVNMFHSGEQHQPLPFLVQQVGSDNDDGETVDDLVCRVLQTLPPLTLDLLKKASCMKDEIDPTLMACLVVAEPTSDGEGVAAHSMFDIVHALDAAVHECLLEQLAPEHGLYRFVHDRIRHAAFSMVEDPQALSLEIGRKLCQQLSSISLRASIFTVVNLMNKGIDLITDPKERCKLAELNLEAGLRAVSMAAFQDSAQYLDVGITLLRHNTYAGTNNSNPWSDQYKLTLSLYNGAADAELCNQQYDRVNAITCQVFQNARCLRDKLPSYISQINALGQRGNVNEAMELGFDVLKQLGEPFPSEPTAFAIMKDLLKTKIMIRGRSNTSLWALKPMVDEQKLAASHIMVILIPYAVQSASPHLVLLGSRLVQTCLKFGLTKACAVGFNTYGWILCRDDRKQGYRFGQLALMIIEKLRARELIPRVYCIFYYWNCHWTRPLRETLEPLRYAYAVGLDQGDIEYGLHAGIFWCFHSFYSGLPLPQVLDMFVDTMKRLRHFKLEILHQSTHTRFQLIQALMQNNCTQSTTNEILENFANEEPSNKLVALLHYSCGTTLAYLLGHMEMAETLVKKRLALNFELFAEYFYAFDHFQHGLIAVARARVGIDKAKNVKSARNMVKMIAVWAKDCPHNFLNKQKLLEAEIRSLGSSKSACQKVHRLYGEAFQMADKEGLTQEAALACELAGDYMHYNDEHHLASTYWDKAHALYVEWGATAKAAQLGSRIQSLKVT